jgi:hypothetical protein
MRDQPADQKKFEELTRDVDWQFNSLVDYIKNGFIESSRVRAKMSSSELVVQNVVEAYLHLANAFYNQFKNELKNAYEPSPGANPLQERVSEADVSILVQQALDKLTAEWARAYGFIAATRTKKASESDRIIERLSPLIRAAVHDVGFSAETLPVIPQFGTAYSLGFFNYADDFMALNLPITALQSPWEWTILWHEIAGQKVRLLKKTQAEFQSALGEIFNEYRRYFQEYYQYDLEKLKQDLREALGYVKSSIVPLPLLHSLDEKQASGYFDILTDCVYNDFMNFVASQDTSLAKTRKFITDLSPERRGLPIFMFSFEDLLGAIMEELRAQEKISVMDNLRDAHKKSLRINKIGLEDTTNDVMTGLFEAWEKALSLEENLAARKTALDEEGWSANWLEELFEDSFSVTNFDVSFLPVFEKVLRRHIDGGKDMRHPPHHIRLAAAAASKILECDETLTKPPASDGLPDGLTDAEKTILKTFYPGSLGPGSLEVVWLVAKSFNEMHKRMKIPYGDLDGAVQKTKMTIANAMKMKKDVGNLDSLEGIAKLARDILAALVDSASTPARMLQGVQHDVERIYNPQYPDKIKALLQSRNIIVQNKHPLGFRELLNLTFYDVDFLGAKITNVMLGSAVQYTEINWMWGALDLAIRSGTAGEVSYIVDNDVNNPRRTVVKTWNKFFEQHGFGL